MLAPKLLPLLQQFQPMASQRPELRELRRRPAGPAVAAVEEEPLAVQVQEPFV